MQNRIIKIFDTTLRDGEQAPGCSMKTEEKLNILAELKKLKVDVVEAGYPAASTGDFESVQAIAKECQESTDPRICALARLTQNDIDQAIEAILPAHHRRLHLFIATSDIHLQEKLKMTRQEVLSAVDKWVRYAADRLAEVGGDLEFSCEDATRTERSFLAEVYQAAINCGATVLNVPDTVGYALPSQIKSLFEYLRNNLDDANGQPLTFYDLDNSPITFSVHGHNDIGLAVANFLAAVEAGAGQVECTLLGIGERAGNGAMEELAAAIKTHQKFLMAKTNLETRNFVGATKLLAEIIGYQVPCNKPVVGANAFAHESGIHQHGVSANPLTYEHLQAEEFGQQTKLILGKHSGRHAFAQRLNQNYRLELSDSQIVDTVRLCKSWADQNKKVPEEVLLKIVAEKVLNLELPEAAMTADDILYFIHQARHGFTSPFEFLDCTFSTAPKGTYCVTVQMKVKGELRSQTTFSVTPIDSIFRAIEEIVRIKDVELLRYDILGTDGQQGEGKIHLCLKSGTHLAETTAISKDINLGSAQAFVCALNRIVLKQSMSQV